MLPKKQSKYRAGLQTVTVYDLTHAASTKRPYCNLRPHVLLLVGRWVTKRPVAENLCGISRPRSWQCPVTQSRQSLFKVLCLRHHPCRSLAERGSLSPFRECPTQKNPKQDGRSSIVITLGPPVHQGPTSADPSQRASHHPQSQAPIAFYRGCRTERGSAAPSTERPAGAHVAGVAGAAHDARRGVAGGAVGEVGAPTAAAQGGARGQGTCSCEGDRV